MISPVRAFILLVLSIFISSCVWQDTTRPSNLVIAVEGLSADSIACDSDEESSPTAFKIICEEAIRFTHAFAPSTMSQANLASVLTGRYPSDHGVWHNGPVFLAEAFQTAAEVAIERGYRTSLFSGGPPIWRKSGLDQGFELFEDNLVITHNQIFRPVGETVNLFIRWLRDEVGHTAFFGLLFVADLQFPQWPTMNEFGQERELGHRGQLDEINESLTGLFQFLKNTGRWGNMNLFLFGLNGRTNQLRTEINAVDLHSSNLQIALFVKPARQDRHQATSWTVDANVSLVDVGATLYDLLGRTDLVAGENESWAPISLRSVFEKTQINWDRDRVIISESAWPEWRGVGGKRFAARQGHMLFVHDSEPLIYNTLIDRLEQQRIAPNDLVVRAWSQDMRRLFQNIMVKPWSGMPATVVEKLRWAEQVANWSSVPEHMKSRLMRLLKTRNWDRQIAGWAASIMIAGKDWEKLEQLGEEYFEPTWTAVARINRGQAADLRQDLCFRHLLDKESLSPSETLCDDDEFLTMVKWIRAESNEKPYAEERFVRVFAEKELEELIAMHNLQNSLKWDTALNIPAGPRRAELVLALPDYRGFAKILQRRLGK